MQNNGQSARAARVIAVAGRSELGPESHPFLRPSPARAAAGIRRVHPAIRVDGEPAKGSGEGPPPVETEVIPHSAPSA